MSKVFPFPPLPIVVGPIAAGDMAALYPTGQLGDGGFPNQYSAFLTGINLNALGDNAIVLPPPVSTRFTRYTVSALSLRNSGTVLSLTTAQIGLFTGAGGTGTALVAGGSALSFLVDNRDGFTNNFGSLAIGVSTTLLFANQPSLFFRVTQIQSAGAAVDAMLIYRPMP